MEVCVDNIQSVINAEKGGAIRIELCSALEVDGLTPTVGLLKMAKNLVKIPIFVMIRPRNGNFTYSLEEIEIMKSDIQILKINGADGFVFGMLTSDMQVDSINCQKLIKLCGDLPKTFHRAFDKVCDARDSMERIIELGFDRILTSGQATTADEGKSLIGSLIQFSQDRIMVMPGAGINTNNLEEILKVTDAQEFHGSAKVLHGDHYITDDKAVRDMMEIYNSIFKKKNKI